MKRILNQFLFAAALVCGAMSVSSCQGLIDAVLGEQVDNPTQPTTTPKDPSTNPAAAAKATDLLADAQKEGATVVFWFTYEDEQYRAVFKKVGDDYVLQNGDAASTRGAGTRSWEELGKGGIKDLKDKLRGSVKIVKPKSVETMRLTIITPKGESVLQMDVNCATGAASQVTADAKTYVDAVATLAAGSTISVEKVEEDLRNVAKGGKVDLSSSTGSGGLMLPTNALAPSSFNLVSIGGFKAEADSKGKTVEEILKEAAEKYNEAVGKNTSGGSSTGGSSAGSSFQPTEITLDPASLELTVEESQQIKATVKPSNAVQDVTWTSNKLGVATVDSEGKVTAVAAGEATITATSKDGSVIAECKVTVTASANTYRVYTSGTAYDDVAIPTDATTVTSSTTTWAAGTYVVSSDVTIASDVTLTGDVNLILSDGAELTVNGCIFGGADYDHGFVYKLNIYGQSSGTGKLTIDYSGSHSLGVVTASELNIHGGEITVKGSAVMQGLEPADLNVYNGTVNATGKANGIIAMGNTHIYGGTVIANSTTNYGAALLSGNDGKTMTISGGVVKATNSGGSAGIETTSNNNLVITGGTVIAQGGNQMEGINSYGTITISGGNVTAKGGAGGGIGLEGKATISGGTVEAIGGDGVADGNKNGASGFDGTLTVTGGTLTATAGKPADGGENALGISGTITLTGVTMYVGDSPNPQTPATDQSVCTDRYVIIK